MSNQNSKIRFVCSKLGKQIFALFILVSCIMSCEGVSEETTLNAKLDQGFMSIKISDENVSIPSLLKKTTYIRLKNSGEKSIGQIDKAISYEGKVFVMDKTFAKSIFVFDSIGNHLYNLDAYGAGPGEYSSMGDFTIDESKKQIIVSETTGRGFLSYSLLDGSFVEEIPLSGFNIDEVVHSNNQFVVNTGNNCYKYCHSLVALESNGNEISRGVKVPDYIKEVNFGQSELLSKTDEGVIMGQIFNDTIYQYKNSVLRPYAVLNAGKYKLKDKKVFALAKSSVNAFIEKAMFYFQGPKRMIDTKDVLFIESNIDYGLCWTMHFKESNTTFSSKNFSLDETSVQFRIPQGNLFGKLYASMDSDELVDLRNQLKQLPGTARNKIDKDFYEILDDVTALDNPVLMLYDLKKQ